MAKPIHKLALTMIVGLCVAPTAHADDVSAGKAKAAPCAACHGEDGNSTNPAYPILAGQTARYIYTELRDFKSGRRKDPFMTPMAKNLSKQDMWDLGNYFAAQKPKPTGFTPEAGMVERGRKVVEDALCTMCHLGGFSGQNEVPRVAGQHQQYIYKQLMAFKNGERTNFPDMTSYVKSIPEKDIKAISEYIANLN
ncbi:MAG: c-type cytochrome [Betaproteobacteria bacterium]|nr:c-type cytochrome [Betaproteobacteria bacterium]